MRQCVACLGTAACCLTGPLAAQTAPEPPSLPLLERFIGLWTMTGTVRARPVTYRLEGGWVLQHRFVELHMEDVEHTPPAMKPECSSGRILYPGMSWGIGWTTSALPTPCHPQSVSPRATA
jgi:hypothetical protein